MLESILGGTLGTLGSTGKEHCLVSDVLHKARASDTVLTSDQAACFWLSAWAASTVSPYPTRCLSVAEKLIAEAIL